MESRIRVPEEYFFIPKRLDFLDESCELELTAQSRELFDLGKPGQGYIGLVDLENKKVHLYPSFNRNDGLLREDKNGRQFDTEWGGKRFVVSKDSLGSLTGDLHINATSELDLVGKSGTRQLLMGFGIWKAGIAIKLLTALPNGAGLVPDEYLLVKENSGWKLFYVDAKRKVTSLEIKDIPGLREIPSLRDNRMPAEIEKKERDAIDNLIRDYHQRKGQAQEHGIKYAKNRSTSQNAHSCLYTNEIYKRWFQAMNLGHTAHTRDLERELPFRVFDKVMVSVCLGLELPPFKDLLDSNVIPGGIDGIRDHFELEKIWNEKILPEMNEALASLEEADLLTPQVFELITRLTNQHRLASDALILLQNHKLINSENIDFLDEITGLSTLSLIEMANLLVYLKQLGLSVDAERRNIFAKISSQGNTKMLMNVLIELHEARVEITEPLFQKLITKVEKNNTMLAFQIMQMTIGNLKSEPFEQLSNEAKYSVAVQLIESDDPEELLNNIKEKIKKNDVLLADFDKDIKEGRYFVGIAKDLLITNDRQLICDNFREYYNENKHKEVSEIIKDWALKYTAEFGANPLKTLEATPGGYFSIFAGNNHFIEAFVSLLKNSGSTDTLQTMAYVSQDAHQKMKKTISREK